MSIDPATARFTTGTNVPTSASIEDYLRDSNHFWTFDVHILDGLAPKPYGLQAAAHRALEVPLLTNECFCLQTAAKLSIEPWIELSAK